MDKVLLVFGLFVGATEALNCHVCDWTPENSTIDDNCLKEPYKVESEECIDERGKESVCATQVEFNVTAGVRGVKNLIRKCHFQHSDCNNECTGESFRCYLCCQTDRCNSFPFSGIQVVVQVTSAGSQQFKNSFLLLSGFLSTVLKFRE